MTNPINPNDSSSTPPVSSPNTPAPSAGNFSSDSSIDPTGVWTKFLSTPGHAATAKEVKTFIEGLMKSFGVLIQQNQKAMERAKRRMERAAKGE